MADERFFPRQPPIRIEEVCRITQATAYAIRGGDAVEADTDSLQRALDDVAPLDRADASHISFLDNTKYIDSFTDSAAGACFIRSKHLPKAPEGMLALVSDEPYRCYALIAQYFYPRPIPDASISPHAHIAATAHIGEQCAIGSGTVISEHAEIGNRCIIQPNVFIGPGVVIGDDSYIGAGATISYSIIGRHAIFHAGVHIGQDGFGFAMGRDGHVKVPQLGRVIIEDDVEIGAGSCIDRGTGPDTCIGAGSKIDNLVQIGHNVQIGKGSVIVAQTGIAGSTRLGDGTVLGGQAGIAGHLKIGPGVRIAAQSGVMTDIPAGGSYGGSPAVPVKDWHRQTVALARLGKKKTRQEEND